MLGPITHRDNNVRDAVYGREYTAARMSIIVLCARAHSTDFDAFEWREISLRAPLQLWSNMRVVCAPNITSQQGVFVDTHICSMFERHV